MPRRRWESLLRRLRRFIDECVKPELKEAFTAYLEYVAQRNM